MIRKSLFSGYYKGELEIHFLKGFRDFTQHSLAILKATKGIRSINKYGAISTLPTFPWWPFGDHSIVLNAISARWLGSWVQLFLSHIAEKFYPPVTHKSRGQKKLPACAFKPSKQHVKLMHAQLVIKAQVNKAFSKMVGSTSKK